MAHLGKRPTEMKKLVQQIQSVPEELHQMILEFTFSCSRSSSNSADAPPAKILHEQHLRGVKVDERYKPPVWLRIGPKGREPFARSYYSNTVFHVKARFLVRWLRSLPPHHANFLTEVRIYRLFDGLDSGDLAMDRLKRRMRSLNRKQNDKAGSAFEFVREKISKGTTVDLGKGVIYTRMMTMDGTRWLWWNGSMPEPADGADEDTRSELCMLSTKYALEGYKQ